ncbi:hypothetical protein [Microbacterium sp. K24]|uniref:hypothetical protein n=1 Tax=Microbacterium sp. K24 TaxID=2305446 RepID=UPI001443B380|nr:hypothetical protein [Microbacterium sp. K24]
MFDVRLRLMSDSGDKGAVLQTLSIDVTQVDSSTPTLNFTVSEKVAGRMDAPQVVAIEYSTGGAYVQPRNGLFMASIDDADDADTNGTVKFTGQGFVSWMLARTYLHWAAGAANGERMWTETGFPASAGTIMGGMILESQGRGWGSMISMDFTWNLASDGTPWTAAEKVKQPWRLLTPLTTVLQSITDQGLCDWWTEGTKLRLFRPGTGVIRENLVLGGPTFSARPTKSSFDDVFTHLTVVPEKADMWLYLPNTGASSRFGRLEATLTQSGVADHATATVLAQAALTGGRAVKREYSFAWTPEVAGPNPWSDFNLGDVVTSKTRHGKSLQRIIGIQVSKKGSTVTAVVKVGDKLLTQAAKVARRTGAGSIGGTIGGGGAAFPIPDATFPVPGAPTGLRLETNVGSWRPDGSAQAAVTIAWNGVTQAADGSAVDVAAYEVAVRTESSESQIFATTEALALTTTEWAPGVVRLVKVRARSASGDVSPWSGEISVTPQVPGLIIPKIPTGLASVSNTAAFQTDGSALATITVQWNAVTQSLDNSPLTVKEYEVKVGLDTQRVTGTTATFTVPSGRGVSVTVAARSNLDVWGDPSSALSITGAAPTTTMPAPSAPVLTAGMGAVAFRWDGLSSAAGSMPAGFNRVVVDVGSSASGPWTALGTPLSAAGGATISAAPTSTVFVRFRSFDTLGRIGGTSAVASATASGISLGDIAPDLAGSLDSIRTTFDGRNRIYTSITEPVGSSVNLAVNPLPLAPSSRGDWRGGGAAAVTVMSDGTPCFQITGNGASTPYIFGANSSLAATAGETYTLRAVVEIVDDVPGATYSVRAHGNTGNVYFPSGSATLVATGAPQQVEIVSTINANVLAGNLNLSLVRSGNGAAGVKLRMGRVLIAKGIYKGPYVGQHTQGDQWWVLDSTQTSIIGVKVWNGLDWVPYLMVADEIIAAGSITSPLFRANSIMVDHLHPSVGDTINLTANAAFNVLVGRQDEQAGQIDSLGGDVNTAQTTADNAQSAASVAQSAAEAVSGRLDQHQLYFKVEVDSVKIGRPDGTSELRLAPEGIQMMQQGVAVSRWEGGVFIADETRLKASSIASHRFEGFGPGRTIIRPL